MSSNERIEQPPLAASQNEMASPKDDPAGAGLTGETSSTSPGAKPREDLLVPEDIATPDKYKESVDRYSRTISTKDISGVFARNKRRHSDSDIKVYQRYSRYKIISVRPICYTLKTPTPIIPFGQPVFVYISI